MNGEQSQTFVACLGEGGEGVVLVVIVVVLEGVLVEVGGTVLVVIVIVTAVTVTVVEIVGGIVVAERVLGPDVIVVVAVGCVGFVVDVIVAAIVEVVVDSGRGIEQKELGQEQSLARCVVVPSSVLQPRHVI